MAVYLRHCVLRNLSTASFRCSSSFHCYSNRWIQEERYLQQRGFKKDDHVNKLFAFHISQQSNLLSIIPFSTSVQRHKDKSKVEQTVEALKSETKENEEKKQAVGSVTEINELGKKNVTAVAVPKKALHLRIIDEVKHYYHGFRLLFIDIRVAVRYSLKTMRGETLSRRERRQLVRTVSDLFRLVPFMVFLVVPFMEFLLPVALKLFPSMLPSTFAQENKEQEKMRKKLKVKLEMAKFLQDTLEETAITRKGAKGETVQEFTTFMEKMRATGGSVSNEEILKYSQLFEDEITLDNLNYRQLRALCKLLDISVVDVSGTVLRFQLELKMRELEADDRMIQKEGIKSLAEWELQEACRARGMRSLGMPLQRLEAQLQQWLDLHLKSKIPTSLLLLSRTLYLPETVPTTDQLKAIITELPVTATEEAKVKISEVSGDRVDNKAKLEIIKQEEQIIMAEKEDFAKDVLAKEEVRRKAAEQAKAAADAEFEKHVDDITQQVAERIEIPSIIDSAPERNLASQDDVIKVFENNIQKTVERESESDISPDDLSDIEDILETVAEERTKMRIEKEDLQELKQDVSEYVETVEELKYVLMSNEGSQLEESKSALHLRKMVNSMIVQMDSVVDDLVKEKEELLENIESKEVKVQENVALLEDCDLREKVLQQITEHKEDLIGVNDILLALKKIQKVPDDTKCQKVAQVAEILDADGDGIIDVAHTLKVIEIIGRENVNLSTKQLSKIIELLQKEKLLQTESKERKIKEKQDRSLQSDNESKLFEEQDKQEQR